MPPTSNTGGRAEEESEAKTQPIVRSLMGLGDASEVAQSVLARARIAADFRQPWEEEWRRSFMAYFQRLDTPLEKNWQSQRYFPLIFTQVETALPSLIAATIDPAKIWTLYGSTKEGRECAAALEPLMTWQANGPMDVEAQLDKGFWWSTLIGTVFFDMGWDNVKEVAFAAKAEEDPNKPGSKRKVLREEIITTADNPVMETLVPTDVYPCPWSEAGDNTDWVIIRKVSTLGKVIEAAELGYYDKDAVDKWRKGDPEKNVSYGGQFSEFSGSRTFADWMREVGYADKLDYVTETDDKLDYDKPIELMVYRSKKETVTLGFPNIVLQHTTNPFIHRKTGIVNHQFWPIPGCPYGRGIGPVLLGHQELLNKNINIYMDTHDLSLMAPIIADKSRVSVTDKDFVWEPNVVVRARGTDAIKRMEVPAPTNLAFAMDQHLRRDADEASGFTEQSRGFAPSGATTATAFSGLQAAVQMRMVHHVRRIRRTMRKIGQILVAMNQQFMTKAQVIHVTGQRGMEYREIEPWQIAGNVVVQAQATASRGNPEMRAQRMLGVAQFSLPIIAGPAGNHPGVRKLIRAVLEANEIDNVDDILPPIPDHPNNWRYENILLLQGTPVDPHPAEDFDAHLRGHGTLLSELMAVPDPDEIAIQRLKEHMAATQKVAAQAAVMQAQGSLGTPAGPGGAMPAEASMSRQLSAAQGSDGTPGMASPGPAAPPGRPL